MSSKLYHLVREALAEDLGNGDVTTSACVSAGTGGKGLVSAQAEGVLSGLDIVSPLVSVGASLYGESCHVHLEPGVVDGLKVGPGQPILGLEGSLRVVLSVERTLLNFLQHLSGVATETARYVQAIQTTGARIVDTRKTTPGLRELEKAAVRHGGGVNHRFGLYDGVLIKDNHIAAVGGITAAIRAARRSVHHLLRVQVECETLEQAEEAVRSGADALLLDNMPTEILREAVGRYKGKVLLEASGGITLANVREVAETGVDIISVGAITHSAPVLPMHLEIVQ
ncbi:MAG: carboxylating nicotinate-nucleotide diphosphorylase [Fimbriimonadia bacterium]|jgi:nicotinate-nucleotide pyrophosphorylase (carboxylating)